MSIRHPLGACDSWTAFDIRESGGQMLFSIVHNGPIAYVGNGGGEDGEAIAEANAVLMAASPELLYACELAFEDLSKMGCECDCEELPTRCAICACKHALAKAKRKVSQ